MSKIVLASSSETWLVSCPGPTSNHFYNNDMEGLGMDKVQEIFYNLSYHEMRASSLVSDQNNETVDHQLFVSEQADSLPITRSSSKHSNREDVDNSNISTPAAESIILGQRHIERNSTSSVSPQSTNGRIKWTNTPRQPIPQLEDIKQWIGHQLNHQRMPDKYIHPTARRGLLITPRGTSGCTQPARLTTDNHPEIPIRRASFAVS